MALKTTNFSESGGVISLNQLFTDDGEDGRVWRDLAGNSYFITDDYKVAKQNLSGTVTKTSVPYTTVSTDKMTLAFSKDQSIVYVFYTDPSNDIRCAPVTTIDMIGSSTFTTGATGKPIRAVISAEPNPEIHLVTDGALLHIMHIDGSYNRSRAASGYHTFGLSIDKYVYSPASYMDGGVMKIKILKMHSVYSDSPAPPAPIVLDSEPILTTTTTTLSTARDSFIQNNTLFVLFDKGYLKVPLSSFITTATWTWTDLTSIPNLEFTQFFTDGVYGYAYRNDVDDQTFTRVNLSTLAAGDPMNYTDLPNLKFSWTTGTKQVIICPLGSNNCDPSAWLVSGKGATGGVA